MASRLKSSRHIESPRACITLLFPPGRRIFFNEEKTFLVRCNVGGSHASNIDGARWCTGDSLKRSKKSGRNWNSTGETRLPHILPYESWHDHPSLRARSPVEIERGLSAFRRDRDRARSSDSRSTRNEHAENEVGIYDISNRRRLELMEALYEMRNDVAVLLKLEKQLKRRIS